MARRRHLDDQAVDELLGGGTPAELAELAWFVADVRQAASGGPPRPSAGLAELFASGLPTPTASPTEAVPAAAGALDGDGRRQIRRKRMIEVLLGKVAAASLLAKAGVAAGAVTLGASAAAATGSMPAPVQNRVADSLERVVDLPGGTDHREDVPAPGGTPAEPASDVADRATSGEPREDGRGFGASVSADARAGTPAATARAGAPTDRPTGSTASTARSGSAPADTPASKPPTPPATAAPAAPTTAPPSSAPAGQPSGPGSTPGATAPAGRRG